MKTALCISGKIGNILGKSGYHSSDPRVLIKGFEHYKRHVIDKNDVDVFIHCWDEELKEETLNLYQPVAHKFEPQVYFDIPDHVIGDSQRKNNHYSRWYSNMVVNNLREQYETENNFKYDFVMTTRFDLAFETDILFSDLDAESFYAGNWSAVYDGNGNDLFKGGRGPLYDILLKYPDAMRQLRYGLKGYPHTQEGFLDLWFIANSKVSSEFFNLFNKLNEYTSPNNCPNDSSGRISNHRLARYHLEQLGYIDKLKFKFHMFDDFPEVRRKYYGCRK
jgi:hypothetical protein